MSFSSDSPADLRENARREFLRQSLAMPLAIGALTGTAVVLTGCSRKPATEDGFLFLRPQDIPMLEKLLPAAIAGNMAGTPEARSAGARALVHSFDRLLMDTSPVIRTTITPLLDLLTLGVTRGPLFGLWKSWESASEADATAVLDNWAGSKSGFIRGAYNGFINLAAMSWYLDADHQAASGYPGPPRKIAPENA